MGICAVIDCGTPLLARDLCERHYHSWWNGKRRALRIDGIWAEPRSRPSPILTEQQIERFWAKVDKTGDCWVWMGYRTVDGYGRLGWGQNVYNASRVAWVLTNGPIPEGLSALHKCNNPPCVRPKHLYLGTQMENMQDRKRAGHY